MRFKPKTSAREKRAERKRIERRNLSRIVSTHVKDKSLVERIGHLVTFDYGVIEERLLRPENTRKLMRKLRVKVARERRANGEDKYIAKPATGERVKPYSHGLKVMPGDTMRFRMSPAVLRYHGGVHKLHTRRTTVDNIVHVESQLNPGYWQDVTTFPM